MADAEASARVFPNDELVAINKVVVANMEFADIIKTAKEATFPLTLTFHCYQMNRGGFEKQKQQQAQPSDRKYSSGPLPPGSPSSAWAAKFGQITRSGSFDQKTINGGNVPRSPSTSSTTSETNTGKFGISLDKVRNTGTDGMKNLFRIMGNKPSKPEEDQSVVRGWMENLSLKPHSSVASGGRHRKTPANANADVLHSTPIVAVTTGGRFVGVLDEDVHEFALTWYRKTPPDNDVHQIKNVNRCPYFPSVDDVGSVLSLQCESLRFPKLKRVVEMPQPLVLDPAVGNMVDVLLEAGAGSFSATLTSNEHDSFQIKIVAEAVTLVKISEQEDEGGVVVKADYSSFLQVLLDPTDQLRFILKVQEFGGFLGNREGDVFANDAFVEGRLAAQDKEIAMLREKLASMSVLQKSIEQEKKQIEASLEVKDNRIELQQMKIRRLEKFPAQCNAQARELQNLRTKLEDEERRHAVCREELEQVASAAAKRSSETQEQGVQTETKFLDSHMDAATFSGSGLQRDAWYGSVATVSADDLQQQIKNQQIEITRLQDEQVNLVAERNMFRAKSGELSKELRKLVEANNNQPLDHIEAQLAERSSLETELALVKAEAKRTADELAELNRLLGSMGDKDKGAKRLVAQNLELQRTVHQLTDSLSESRDQW
ncbi:hypothetical protein BBO99_00008856 [Phytophthora kernoviae]|uniref:PDZ domain-containing protein n=2 Tax=Phytophthora kernoviae TaxID=325452 RepID=A0A3R7GRA5_9STRA|nr:hypothetical protein G195_010389 [Phytophthora kernoviae 00238/432]KAG2509567.1 hypothetical protein JM16_008619 [Phytophthora kernoviae]KAG2511024.1 hypothetical protein JM18_008650 [Phytophthora kernoviae]RLN32506.1 hypothetical protein BBI17_008875 [Phytophthora kernoviae]RLN74631.1 hypothetical protein BBO99_00008856 [Phytophthora kernoviae]